jgi:hypothetical protein
MGQKAILGLIGLALMALVVAVLNTGCASYAVMKSSQRELQQQKALKAVKLGEAGAGIGVDVTALEALTYQPLMQVGAAVLDAGLIYGAYRGLDAIDQQINGQDDDEPTVNVENSPGAQVNVSGDGSPASSSQSTDNSSHQ